LLVVIAIIALLIAILLPSLNLAKRRANTSRCLTSVRGLGQAVQLYTADFNAMFPFSVDPDRFWVKLLSAPTAGSTVTGSGYGATDKLRVCPEAAAPNSTTTIGTAHFQWYGTALTGPLSSSYGINGWVYAPAYPDSQATLYSAVAATHDGEYYRILKANRTSEIPIFADCNYRHLWAFPSDRPPSGANNLEDNGPDSTTGSVDQVHPLTRSVMDRHSKAVNVSFADSHAETVKLQQLWTLKWNSDWVQPNVLPMIPAH